MPAIPASNTTLEYFDGFDDYSTAQATRYWSGESQSAVGSGAAMPAPTALSLFSVSAGNGRNGSASIRMSTDRGSLILGLTAQATRTAGVAVRLGATFAGGGASCVVIGFADALVAQVALSVFPDGSLGVTRGPGANAAGTILGRTGPVLSLGVWYYLEFQATIHPTAGTFAARLNGASIPVLSGTGANTRQTANSSANQVFLGGIGSAGLTVNWDFDDFYVRSDATFLGDCRVETKLPTGNGVTTNFTRGGTDSGTNWGQVDENPATDDTDYVQSGTAGDLDLYTYPALASALGTVYGVMAVPILRNDAAGTVQAAAAYRSGGTVYTPNAQTVGSTTYAAYMDIQGQNPNGPAAWTIPTVNAAQFGIKRIA